MSWLRLLIFLVAWGVLDTLFNLRSPGGEPAFWYVLPSIDVVVLLAAFMLLRTRGYRVADGLRFALVVLVLAVRIFRSAEGLVERHFHRPLNLYVDIALLPNLAGLLRSTVSWQRLCAWGALIAIGLVALGALCWWALAATERALSWAGPRRLFVAGLVVCLLLSPLWSRRRHPEMHVGLFGTSIVPRLAREVSFLRHAPEYRRESLAGITRMRERLGTIPTGLELLHHADVQLILVESYGETVLERADFARRIEPVYNAFEAELGEHGFAIASSLLSSPTYGGRSWLAHAALATGVRTDDGLAYAVLLEAQPPPLTMAGFFRAAGYRTVLVQPGTTSRWPEGEVVGFDKKYYLMDLDYQGPPFKWATMPDQYVLDFIHRREVERRPGTTRDPLFVEYALVSSHSPWSLQPRVVAELGPAARRRRASSTRWSWSASPSPGPTCTRAATPTSRR